MKIGANEVLTIVFAIAVIVMVTSMTMWDRGNRWGTCVELCRPAKFDSAQRVNGGCLCIGSDKVLRIKEAP